MGTGGMLTAHADFPGLLGLRRNQALVSDVESSLGMPPHQPHPPLSFNQLVT